MRGKLASEDRAKVVERFKAGEKAAKLATEYGVSRQAVYALAKRGGGFAPMGGTDQA